MATDLSGRVSHVNVNTRDFKLADLAFIARRGLA